MTLEALSRKILAYQLCSMQWDSDKTYEVFSAHVRVHAMPAHLRLQPRNTAQYPDSLKNQ